MRYLHIFVIKNPIDLYMIGHHSRDGTTPP